jgi:NADH dehydrogenase [ubiquinone] 1 alpha subcomplex assembly factor 7
MLPAIFIANEFFDALPVEQFVCQDNGWHRRLVALTPESSKGAPSFVFTLAPASASPEELTGLPSSAEAGAIIESSPASQQIATEIARRIRSHTGAAIVVDYGYAGPAIGDTLQAVHRHNYAPVLERPGEADLTAHVDFNALAQAARSVGADCWGPVPQGEFLRRLGIETRASSLIAKATPQQKSDIESARNRLIGDDQMGTLFKVMAIGPRAAAPPAGFLPEDANIE